ncbi:unnamed protein product [Didymodactylos carnosus]|uniref:NAD(P)(+)--arginine ADP-ribosyltransferase n=1 Tax=Didymodactylos carnosus TaxID=1234261 RepID=A0A814CTM5_9BILA|nr:unnamed protein product [Didymodactylos carnosus]CAF0946732.1 unnamed protein product [Didymodactylos carnosus]CAF3659118.1 unnamed protein product [Didymodactylos carnosus]CAF3722857.1 unnamed protein product [Didymodactylos carnosus]
MLLLHSHLLISLVLFCKWLGTPNSSAEGVWKRLDKPNSSADDVWKRSDKPYSSAQGVWKRLDKPNSSAEDLRKWSDKSYSSSESVWKRLDKPNSSADDVWKRSDKPHSSAEGVGKRLAKPNLSKEAIWHWKSNPNPFDPRETPQWTQYSDIDNDIIEEAFIKKEKQVGLENYWIDFEKMLQITKPCGSEQREIKRVLIDHEQNLRHERFFVPPKLTQSFSVYSVRCEFVNSWINSFKDSGNTDVVLKQAGNGILIEGEQVGEITDAKWCAEQLNHIKHEDEIDHCVIYIYTKECFLYKMLNTTLRENDMTKVKTLGPFCYLLDIAMANTKNKYYTGYLYRGAQLHDNMIQDYLKAVGQGCRSWSAFTSTSKSRSKAEEFGDTLFIINIIDEHSKALDISSNSVFPKEEEVLLPDNWNFIVEKVDKINGKNHIYLRRSKDHK